MVPLRNPRDVKQVVSHSTANKILFVLVFSILFILPLFPTFTHHLLFSTFFTFIILAGTQLISKNRMLWFSFCSVAIALVWIGDIMDLPVIKAISKGFNMVLYIFIVADLVKQLSRAKVVSADVILEAINGYLMIGLVFAIVVAFLMSQNPASFSFSDTKSGILRGESPYHQYIYFAFITLTTVGYGDVVPLSEPAKSLSIMISLTGQLYIAIVIAVLVGKYISQDARAKGESK
jgi:voltage-gated potassium channel